MSEWRSETQGFVLPRFGSCKPTPRWGGHKGRVYFNPFPLSNDPSDRVSFSSQINREQSFPARTTTQLVSLASVTIEFWSQEQMRKKRRKSSNEHNKSLSLVTKALCGIGEDLITLVCLELNARALVNGWKVENLDDLNVGWLGVFIAPTTKLAVWWRLLSHGAPDNPVRHRIVSGAPATSPGR
jgi:hypothetical protein